MIQLTKLLISKGEFVNSEVTTIEESVKAIQNSREWLHSQKIDDILEYVEIVGKHWSNNFENNTYGVEIIAVLKGEYIGSTDISVYHKSEPHKGWTGGLGVLKKFRRKSC